MQTCGDKNPAAAEVAAHAWHTWRCSALSDGQPENVKRMDRLVLKLVPGG